MAFAADYVEVAERLAEFYDKFPEGSLQMDPPQLLAIGNETVLWARAYAYRHPNDPNPGVGTCSEAFPGRTPYTKGSELMNLETSCWGRAMASLGIATKRGIATGHEIRMAKARQGQESAKSEPVTDSHWLIATETLIAGAAGDDELAEIRERVAEAVAAGKVSTDDSFALAALWKQRKESLPPTDVTDTGRLIV